MSKVDEAQELLRALQLPLRQQNAMSGYTLLALAGVRATDPWSSANRQLIGVRPIIRFINSEYGQPEYDREGIRRQALHQFEEHRLVDLNPDQARPTNSGKACYALTEEALAVLRLYGAADFAPAVEEFVRRKAERLATYQRSKQSQAVVVELPDGVTAYLSAGAHNQLQSDILRHFYPMFIPEASLAYLSDTANRKEPPYKDDAMLVKAGLPYSEHAKFPDVVFWWDARSWLVLVEAVTSHGPFSLTRKRQMEDLLRDSTAHVVYVTAFPDMREFKRHLNDLAWDTEVWIAEDGSREHMIHFNGPKFLAPATEDDEGD